MRSAGPHPTARAKPRPKRVVGAVHSARSRPQMPPARTLGTHIVSATLLAYSHARLSASHLSVLSPTPSILRPRGGGSRWRARLLFASLVATALAFVWGFFLEPQRLVVTRAQLQLPG